MKVYSQSETFSFLSIGLSPAQNVSLGELLAAFCKVNASLGQKKKCTERMRHLSEVLQDNHQGACIELSLATGINFRCFRCSIRPLPGPWRVQLVSL